MTTYQLRPAADKDQPFLWNLLTATMKEYVTQIWGWDEVDQQRRFAQNFPPARYQILMIEGEDIGAVAVQEKPAELFLASLLVLPKHQRRGIGTAVIQDLIGRARTMGVPITLRVLKVNPAVELYRRLGFTPIEETPTDFVMRRDPGDGRSVPG